jgi:3-hydroxyisobutyrate dehydrogenase
MNITFLGTGLMGLPMAENLIKSGNRLTVYNRTKSKTKPLAELGAIVCDSAVDAADANETIISMLTDFPAFKDAILSQPDLNLNGKVVIQMSTIAPAESKELQDRLIELGAEYLEAPVLGSIPQVQERTLFVLVGGNKEKFEKHKPIFKQLGDKVYYTGEVGSASSIKLALNQLIASMTAAFSMSHAYLINSNGNTDLFMEILRGSALYSPTFDKKLENMNKRNFSNPNFPLKHLLKDVNLMLDDFEKENVNVSPLRGVQHAVLKGIELGFGEDDYSAIYNGINLK